MESHQPSRKWSYGALSLLHCASTQQRGCWHGYKVRYSDARIHFVSEVTDTAPSLNVAFSVALWTPPSFLQNWAVVPECPGTVASLPHQHEKCGVLALSYGRHTCHPQLECGLSMSICFAFSFDSTHGWLIVIIMLDFEDLWESSERDVSFPLSVFSFYNFR